MLASLALALFSVPAGVAAPIDAQLPFSAQSTGVIPPLLSKEFAFTFVQHKFNENGFGVSHQYGGMWFSSFSRGLVRVDTVAYDWITNNSTLRGPLGTSIQSSYFDFTHTPETQKVINKFIQGPSPGNVTCSISELPVMEAAAQLFPPTFLRDNAQYSGEAHLPSFPGSVDVFTTFFGSVVVDFYFTKAGSWVRFDQHSPHLKTTVITDIFNFAESAEFADHIFAGYGSCYV